MLKRNTPIHVIDGADLAAWKKATEPIYAKWIEERNKAGDKGAELVKAGARPGGEVLPVNDARAAQDIDRAAPAPHGPVGRALEARLRWRGDGWVACCLIAIMLVSSLSVIGRGLSQVFAAREFRAFPATSRSCSSAAPWPCSPSCRSASSSAPTCW